MLDHIKIVSALTKINICNTKMIQISASETECNDMLIVYVVIIPGKVGNCAPRVDFFIQNLKVTFKFRELCWFLLLSLLSLFIIHAIFSSAGAQVA